MLPQSFPKAYRTYLLLFAVFFIGLFIRLWLLDKRWINPDEGAHLMDAALALEGNVPQVDFGTRQPLYVYALAGFLKIFGTDYIAGRLLSVTCSMLTGIVVFLIARALFDVKVALLSSAVFWTLPLEVLQSAIVKTEPLAMLLTSLSMYAAVRFSQRDQGLWLIAAGALAAMGFYVRQSTLIIPLTVFGFVVLFHRGRVREVAKSVGLFLAGYAAAILLVLMFYSRFMSPADFLTGEINPIGFLIWAGEKGLSLLGLRPASTDVATGQASDIPWNLYSSYVYESFSLHSFLLIGAAFSAATLGCYLLTHNRQMVREYITRHSILYFWVFSLFLAYAFFFFIGAKFYIDYFREFLPPLVIILSAWICHSAPALERDGVLELFIPAGLCLSVVWFFFMQSDNSGLFGIAQQMSLAIALMALFYFTRVFESPARRYVFVVTLLVVVVLVVVIRLTPLNPYLSGAVPSLGIIGLVYGITWALLGPEARPSPAGCAKFFGLSIVLGSLIVSVGYSGDKLSLDYHSTWSPRSVEKTAEYLKAHTRSGDEVMSGAVIWELQASRRPFQMISHPLAFLRGIPGTQLEKITHGIAMSPPKVIILDGYTERTYLHHLPWLIEILEARYTLSTTEGPAKYPIKIYRLKDESVHVAGDL